MQAVATIQEFRIRIYFKIILLIKHFFLSTSLTNISLQDATISYDKIKYNIYFNVSHTFHQLHYEQLQPLRRGIWKFGKIFGITHPTWSFITKVL